MEAAHYENHKGSRQSCPLNINFAGGYVISGGPVNFPENDGVAFKYIYQKS